MTIKNPLSPAAMAKEDIAAGRRFVWYKPFDDDSLVWGEFVSDPYFNSRDEEVVDFVTEAEPNAVRTVDLISMGIVPSNLERNEWSDHMTVPRSPDD